MDVNNCMNPLIISGTEPDIKNIAQFFLFFAVLRKSPKAQNKKKNGIQLAKSNKAKLLFQFSTIFHVS